MDKIQVQKVGSNTFWENSVGYSRAVRIGQYVEVAGTTAVQGDQIIGQDDPFAQTVFVIKKIEKALHDLGARLDHVIRTRIYVSNIDHWEMIGQAHGKFFSEIKPACTMIEVSRLIKAELLVEIEATAIIH
ncbi:MAG: RidA family protein [Saprospiraceae bacterium]|nr:RidA family protein [Saprospiraceae bacterium]